MEQSVSPRPDVVAEEARSQLEGLRRWAGRLARSNGLDVSLNSRPQPSNRQSFFAVPLGEVLESLHGQYEDGRGVDWDTATQMYLASVALNIERMDRRQQEDWRPSSTRAPDSRHLSTGEHRRLMILKEMRHQLTFPKGQQSPPPQWGRTTPDSRLFYGQLHAFLQSVAQHD